MQLLISPCPNDTFIFDAIINKRIDLEAFDFDVEYYDIERLNELAQTCRPHFIKVSAAMIPILYKDYALSCSGAALGWGNGPLLVRAKGEDRALRRVAVPGLSTTANMLLKRYFPEVEQLQPMLFSHIAAAVKSGEVDAGVLIHEGRFTYHNFELELVADMGQLWEEELGVPLPLGVIMMRRDVEESQQHSFELLVRQSILYAQANPAESEGFIAGRAQEMERSVIESHIKLFVNEFSLDLGEVGISAIEEFTSMPRDKFM